MQTRIVRLEEQPEAVRRFFAESGAGYTLVESEGKPFLFVSPATPTFMNYEATDDLKDSAGGWETLPQDVVRAIAGIESERESNQNTPSR
jgi:hypothetical protein